MQMTDLKDRPCPMVQNPLHFTRFRGNLLRIKVNLRYPKKRMMAQCRAFREPMSVSCDRRSMRLLLATLHAMHAIQHINGADR